MSRRRGSQAALAAGTALLLAGAVGGIAGGPAAAAPGAAGAGQAPGAPAPADTATVLLSGPAAWPAPLAIALAPDSVLFGAETDVVLTFPPGEAALVPGDLVAEGAALAWSGPGRSGTDAGPDRGGPPDRILRRPARLLAPGAVRLAWRGGGPLPVVGRVGSRLADGRGPADVRPPAPLGWRWWWLPPGLAALALLLAAAAAGLRRRRAGGPRRADDRPLPPPAHLAAAVALAALVREGLPAAGHDRGFLDRLAAIVRRYLAGRFGVPAPRLAAPEVEPALRRRGHRGEVAARFAALLAACDDARYGPARLPAAACERLLAEAIAVLAAARVEARYTPVPDELAARGRRAWRELAEVAADLSASAPGEGAA